MQFKISKRDLANVEKIWLKSYPPTIPAEINPDAYQSIAEVFNRTCQRYNDQPAFYNLGVTLTYRQLDRYAHHFAAYLQQELRLKKGDRFAIMLPNILQYPIALFGALRAGLIVVNVNPLYTADELIFQLNDANAEALVVMTNFAYIMQKAQPNVPQLKNIIVAQLVDLFPFFKSCVTNFALKYFYRNIPAWDIPHAISFKSVLDQGNSLPFIPVSQ